MGWISTGFRNDLGIPSVVVFCTSRWSLLPTREPVKAAPRPRDLIVSRTRTPKGADPSRTHRPKHPCPPCFEDGTHPPYTTTRGAGDLTVPVQVVSHGLVPPTDSLDTMTDAPSSRRGRAPVLVAASTSPRPWGVCMPLYGRYIFCRPGGPACYDHTMLNTPGPIRSPKLSNIGLD